MSGGAQPARLALSRGKSPTPMESWSEVKSSVAGSRHDVVTQAIDSGAIALKRLIILALLFAVSLQPAVEFTGPKNQPR